jgi:hypothetical protein
MQRARWNTVATDFMTWGLKPFTEKKRPRPYSLPATLPAN